MNRDSSGKAPAGTVLYRGVDNHDQRPRASALAAGNAGMHGALPALDDGAVVVVRTSATTRGSTLKPVVAESLAAALRPYRKEWLETLEQEGKRRRAALDAWRKQRAEAKRESVHDEA